jgi:hypothetical protein
LQQSRQQAKRKGERGWFKIGDVPNGKVDLSRQLRGLDIIRAHAKGAAVLDLGCAEGLISLKLAESGARLIHGIELIGERLTAAEQLFSQQYPHVERRFIPWDLSRFDELVLDVTPDSKPGQPALLTRYEIVLCLAIAQKLPNPGRFLRLASILSSDWIAIRLPYPIIDDPRSFNIPVDVSRMLSNEFDLIQATEGYPFDLRRPHHQGDDAWLGIFRRRSARATGRRMQLGALSRWFGRQPT